MTWTNAFDLGACTVEVFQVDTPDAPDYSGVLAKGASADLTLASWAMHIAVSADGVVTLTNQGSALEVDVGARIIPGYSVTDAQGAKAVLPTAASGAGNASANGSSLASFTNGDASVDLSAQTPYDRISVQTNTIGSSTVNPVVQFTPEFQTQTLIAGDKAVVVEAQSTENVVTVSVADSGTPVTPDSVDAATQPDNGAVSVSGVTFLYTPNPGYEGLDSFTYTADVDGLTSSVGTVSIKVVPTHNCDCSDTSGNRTLASLRGDLARRLGFGAQVNNLPPGMLDLLNCFLIEAQELLYRRYDVLRTERFYSWFLQEGVRMYDFADNDESCTKRLDSRKVTWVGIERDGIWYPLTCGIPPELYSNNITGWRPERYEIRQCIEVWPVPDATIGSLIIKGHFGLEPFAADSDVTTIDDRLVFLLALANAKAHYGRPDANNYIAQLESMMANLVAGSHHTARYIPGRDDRFNRIYVEPKPLVPFG